MPEQISTSQEEKAQGGIVRRRGGQLQARLQPVVRMATAIIGKVKVQAMLAAGACVWLWLLIFFPFAAFGKAWVVVVAIFSFVLLAIPPLILFLFWAGLREVIRLPDRLVEMAGTGEDQALSLYSTVVDSSEPEWSTRLWRFFRTVLELRTVLLSSKGMVLQVTALARLVNPLFIAVLFISFVASLVEIAVAGLTFFFWAFF